MRNKYKKSLSIIIILLVVASLIGFSYAYYEKNIANRNAVTVLTDEVLSINYLDGKEYNIKDFNKDDVYYKKVSVTNVSNEKVNVTISLMDVEKTSDDISLAVINSNGETIYDKKVSNVDTEVIKSEELGAKKTLSYTFMIKNNGDEKVDFSADILVYKDSIVQEKNTFKEIILKNTPVKSSSTNPGVELAKEDEGLIQTIDDQGDAYYFRGNVSNNNVKFANQNFKITRINGDGSVRLVLADVLGSNSAFNDNTEVVEDYATKLLFSNSKVKTVLDEWINTLGENSKYIVESIFCEDTNIANEENNVKYLSSYNRIFLDENPTLTCLGNKLKLKVGLLTADEVTLAGALKKNSNNNYYLFDNSINVSWWTMSGSQILTKNNAVDAISVNKDGSLNYEKMISTSLGVRPVISLLEEVTVTGTGTVDDPYVLQ